MEVEKTLTLRIGDMFSAKIKTDFNGFAHGLIDPMEYINFDCDLEDTVNGYIEMMFEENNYRIQYAQKVTSFWIGYKRIATGQQMRERGYRLYIMLYNRIRDLLIMYLPKLSDNLLELDHYKSVEKFNESVHEYCIKLLDVMLSIKVADERVVARS